MQMLPVGISLLTDTSVTVTHVFSVALVACGMAYTHMHICVFMWRSEDSCWSLTGLQLPK